MKKLLNPETSMGAVPVVMVSCGDEKESNITTIAWTGILNSEPPLVYISIRPTRKSYHIIKEKKEFVMNIPDENLVWEADFCGTKSGKEIDKFKEANLTKEKTQLKKPKKFLCFYVVSRSFPFNKYNNIFFVSSYMIV